MSAPAFLVLPALDDWHTSRPIRALTAGDLLPGRFWRPIEALQLALVGQAPSLHPAFLHALAVAGHGVAVALVYRLARSFRVPPGHAAAAAAAFAVAPATAAAVWSVDGAIQTWSTAFGLAAFLAYRSGSRRVAAWLSLSLVAALWKESGLAWLFAVPLLHEALLDAPDRSWTRLRGGLIFGLGGFALWLAARTTLGDGLEIGDGRYAFSLDPTRWARNAAMLLGVSATTLDTIHLLGPVRRLGGAALTALAGLPLLVLPMAAAVKRREWTGWWLAGAGLLAVISPHLPQGHVSEMYAHPATAAWALVLLAALRRSDASRMLAAALALFLASAVVVDAHKLDEMIRTGRGAQTVGRRIAQSLPSVESIEGPLCLVLPADSPRTYSVFVAPPGPAAGWGMAVMVPWGWPDSARFVLVTEPAACPGSHAVRGHSAFSIKSLREHPENGMFP
jgi:hypothetical protein